MKPLTNTIDLNAEPKFYTLAEIRERERDRFEEWEIRNDLIKSVHVVSCDHGFICLGVDYESGGQGVGYGYRSEGNIGIEILHLARLVGCYAINGDILSRFAGTPIRVLHRDVWGDSVAKNTYIGHFMKDRWIYCQDWITAGIVAEGVAE